MMKRDYLLEIGCEELPAGFVGPALWFGREKYDDVLKKERLSFDGVEIYGTSRAQSVDVSAMKLFQTDRGEYLGYVKEEAARPVEEILPQLVSDWIPTIPFKKTMRWADLEVRFARPMHSIVSLYGDKVIPLSFGNVAAGNTTYGHRFLAPGAITLASPGEYLDKLAQASVFGDFEVG